MRAKLVNEAIGFERYRNPKEALGLDMYAEIKDWCKKIYGIIPANDEVLLHYCVVAERLDYVKYLVEVKKVKIISSALNTAMLTNNEDMKLFLITNGNQDTINYIKNQKGRKLFK